MTRATPRMRSLARRLMVAETAGPEAEPATFAAFPVTEKLRPHLALLMGRGGVRALIGRALVLAQLEVAWLRTMRVADDGSLEGPGATATGLDPADLFEGRVVLLAQLLGLLVAFVGPALTSRLVGEIWPQVPMDDRDFGKEVDDEKTR